MDTPPDHPALFLLDGEGFTPTVHTRGPWDPAAQHGGAPAALVARCIDRVETTAPMRTVRMTLNLLRPVPLRRLRVRTTVTRPGRRVQLVEAVVLDGDTEVVRAEALRLRVASLHLPEAPAAEPLGLPTPDQSSPVGPDPMEGAVGFPTTGCELRFARGAFLASGPAATWIRLRVPVVEGEEPDPLARVAAAADFGNGVSSVLDWQRRLFINPDLGIWLARHPVGEWVCLDAQTLVDAEHGSGMAESALWDEQGRIGRSTQSLLIDTR